MTQKSSSPIQLPQKADTWFICLREISLQLPGTTIKPTALLLMDLTQEELLGFDVYESKPNAELVHQHLWKSMRQPQMGDLTPHRPQEVQFEQAELLNEIAPLLAEIHVASSVNKAPPLVDALISGLIETLGSTTNEPAGLLSVPGTDPKMIASLFDAAAFFYRAAPWKRIIDYQTLAVTIDPPGQQLFVQVMGNGGMEFGLSLYTAWEDVLHVFEHAESPLDVLPESGMHGLTFGPKDDLPAEDQAAMRKYGWKTAGRNACPLPFTFTKEGKAERPSRQELLYYEALLRSLPAFLKDHLVDDGEGDFEPIETAIQGYNFDGPVSLNFRYPAGMIPDWEWVFFQDEGEDEDEEDTLELPEELLQANRLADQAWEEGNSVERLRLARKALEISADCVEAYLVLAYETETPEEAQAWLEKAVQAGERALGQEFIEENEGFLWDYHEARPYLRALDGLAENLEALDREGEALTQYNRLLDLNEEDHQGSRYNALRLQLHLRLDKEARDLIEEYGDDASATWAYSRALLAFRESGDLTHSRKELKSAIRTNPYVPAYLTGAKPLPAEAPEAIGFGDESEAIEYVSEHYPNWWTTPGAVDWLKKQR